jgi:starch synthase (maltosyl-transferring)
VIAAVRPVIDGGRYAAQASLAEPVAVSAEIFSDGHDRLAAEIRYRHHHEIEWHVAPLRLDNNDHWTGEFPVVALGRYQFSIRAVVDEFATWRDELVLRANASQDLSVQLLVGSEILQGCANRAKSSDRRLLAGFADALESSVDASTQESVGIATDVELADLVRRYLDPRTASTSTTYSVDVERELARYSSWYEMFPRSASPDPFRPGTFADVIGRLPYVARLGFNVLYLPPIHPIGITARKGPGGTLAKVGDPGSPWAIGDQSGGHSAVHPELGSLSDFDALVEAADAHGIEIALDLAFQCSPDHPWVTEHPTWFRHLPDGTIKYAENPPKRYEDVYPLDFASPDWRELWGALHQVVEFWISRGVRVFRVDNPHTKPLRFWEWLIATVREEHPEVIMLAEAFTRPRIMEHLAKVGFAQSYTYFTWRNSAGELRDYLSELTTTRVADYFRPNLWPNTPDILHETLQRGGRPAFISRLVLAATLSSSYGIYGPVYELCVNEPLAQGSEEYANSEKFEVRHWDLDQANSLSDVIALVNTIRREHPALQQNRTLRFHSIDNDRLLVFSKSAREQLSPDDTRDSILVAVNLDPSAVQAGTVYLDAEALGIDVTRPYVVHDLLTDARYTWNGGANYIRLDPLVLPAHIFHVEQQNGTSR